MRSAWKSQHDLAEDACPECQGSTYVPASSTRERIVDECPECQGTGRTPPRKLPDGAVVSLRTGGSLQRRSPSGSGTFEPADIHEKFA